MLKLNQATLKIFMISDAEHLKVFAELGNEDIEFIFKHWIPWEQPKLKNATTREFVEWIDKYKPNEQRRKTIIKVLLDRVPFENLDAPLIPTVLLLDDLD